MVSEKCKASGANLYPNSKRPRNDADHENNTLSRYAAGSSTIVPSCVPSGPVTNSTARSMPCDEGRASPIEPLLVNRARLLSRHQVDAGLDPRWRSEQLRKVFVDEIWPNLSVDYKKMVEDLKELLQDALRNKNIDAQVIGRAKEVSSVKKTIKRREEDLEKTQGKRFESLEQIFDEMHDLAGLRIVVTFPDDLEKAKQVVRTKFTQRKEPGIFRPDRKVYKHWKEPWFGAYAADNHRVALPQYKPDALLRYDGIMFEIQVVSMAEDLYNKLAHDLLYKEAGAGEPLTLQDEMTMDLSHGLAKCFALSVLMMKGKLKGSDTPATRQESEKFGIPDQASKEVESAVNNFWKDTGKEIRFQNDMDAKFDKILRVLQFKIGYHSDEDKQCLRAMRCTDSRLDKKRIEETKGGLLKDAYRWILDNPQFQQWRHDQQSGLLWIRGGPGKGKTMLLCGIIDELDKSVPEGSSPAFFFCQATDERINNATSVILGLMYQLVNLRPSLISHVRKKFDSAGEKLFQDVNAWVAVSDIMVDILRDHGSVCLIIDALDECTTGLPQLLNFIATTSSECPHVKWLVSSRDVPDVELSEEHANTPLCLELNTESVRGAVEAYINYKMSLLAKRNKISTTKPPEVKDKQLQILNEVDRILKKKANGTFLWVALVCKEIEECDLDEVVQCVEEMPSILDEVYAKMMRRIDKLKGEQAKHCRQVLIVAVNVYRPLHMSELAALASLPNVAAHEKIVRRCGLFIIKDATVYFVHQSAKDYLVTEPAVSDILPRIFPAGHADGHRKILSQSIECMTHSLRRDVYNLGTPGFLIDDVQLPDRDPLAEVAYSCVYWVDHLCEGYVPDDLQDGGPIYTLLKERVLYWFEALSLLRKIPHGVKSLVKLEELLKSREKLSPQLTDLAQDAWRFIGYFGSVVEKHPLQLYASGLVFSPNQSVIKSLFGRESLYRISPNPIVGDKWSACLRTLEGHSSSVSSVALSGDGRLLASGSDDRTVKLWDAATGQLNQTLQGHSNCVSSVAFSGDGRLVASGSGDRTVKLWDAATGQLNQTLQGHSDWVSSVAFSGDGRLVASGSEDRTVKLWDAATGKLNQTFNVSRGLYDLEFNATSSHLLTGIGAFTINIQAESSIVPTSSLLKQNSLRQGYGISGDEAWVVRESEKWLWLPHEYRPSYNLPAVMGSSVAIGCSSGRVLILGFIELAY